MIMSNSRFRANDNRFTLTSDKLKGLLLPFIFFCLAGCDSRIIYDNTKSIRDDVWKSDQIIRNLI